MASAQKKKSLLQRLSGALGRWFTCPFREKNELLKEIEISRTKISDLENEVFELKRENNDLESRMENYKKNSDRIDFMEEFGSMDMIIQKVGEYDRNEIIIRDLEMENKKLEQENRKLKSLI